MAPHQPHLKVDAPDGSKRRSPQPQQVDSRSSANDAMICSCTCQNLEKKDMKLLNVANKQNNEGFQKI